MLVRRLPTWRGLRCRLDKEAGAGLFVSPDGRQLAFSRVDQKIEVRSFPDLQPIATLLVKDLMGATRVDFGDLNWSPDSRKSGRGRQPARGDGLGAARGVSHAYAGVFERPWGRAAPVWGPARDREFRRNLNR